MNLKYIIFQQFSPKKLFRICTHFWQCVRPVYVTSQEDMNDSHFLPLDIASTCNSTSVLFLWGNKLNVIIIDAGLDLVLEFLSTTHTVVEMTKFIVCVTKGHTRLFFVASICCIIEWIARNSGRNLCRSTCTTSVLISLSKWKQTLKNRKHRLCMHGLDL